MKSTSIKISGMACSGCAQSVEKALNELDGMNSAEVELKENKARVSYDENMITEEQLKNAIQEAGYEFDGIEG